MVPISLSLSPDSEPMTHDDDIERGNVNTSATNSHTAAVER